MSINYIVSGLKEARDDSCDSAFVADLYTYYNILNSDHLKSKWSQIDCIEHWRKTREDFEKDVAFVMKKYELYLKIFAEKLNNIHQVDFSDAFWKKTLSFGLLRMITFVFEAFQTHQRYFNHDAYKVKVLSKDSFYIPKYFDDQRFFFQHSNIGQEQLFSQYCKVCIDGEYPSFENKYDAIKRKPLRKYQRNFFPSIYDVLRKLFEYRKPEVMLFSSFFNKSFYNRLVVESLGEIHNLFIAAPDFEDIKINSTMRETVSMPPGNADLFDNFFFKSCKDNFPIYLLEGFSSCFFTFEAFIKKQKKVRYVVSEAWPSNSFMAFAIAFLQKHNIKHIHNEHNFLHHHLLGSTTTILEAEYSDVFLSLGWEDAKYKNIIPAGSAYTWTVKKESPSIDLLYIGGVGVGRKDQLSAAFGRYGELAERHLQCAKIFFNNIPLEVKLHIYYRAYPIENTKVRHFYSEREYFKDTVNEFQNFDDSSICSAKELMGKAKLIVVGYQSTPHLESIKMDIPTVFFWDPESYYLNDNHLDFFDELIDVGICQTDPVVAAHFIEQIYQSPNAWWKQKNVQKAKNNFLNNNLRKPDVLKSYLLGLLHD